MRVLRVVCLSLVTIDKVVPFRQKAATYTIVDPAYMYYFLNRELTLESTKSITFKTDPMLKIPYSVAIARK